MWLQIRGPGGSGIEFLLKHGKTIQKIADSDVDPSDPNHGLLSKYFDIIGVDAHGVNNTVHISSAFQSPS